jgi:tetratricopeptide (TPR) repeat protein
MGATASAIELLTPLGASDDVGCWTEIAIALSQAFRHEEALQQDLRSLAKGFEKDYIDYHVLAHLGNVAHDYTHLGKLRSATRYLEFRDELIADDPDRHGVNGHAMVAAISGQTGRAIALFEESVALEDDGTLWVEADRRYWQLYFALRVDDSLTKERLDEADVIADTWLERRNLQQLRRDFFIQRAEFGRALEAAYDCDRIERDSGMESVPAATAYLLARLGRSGEAAAAVEESLGRLSRIDAAIRPHYHLALALNELGRRAEAVAHAREAYRQAWGEGPPFCQHWKMLDARALLAELGEPEPELPVVDKSTWQVPLEAEIRAFISRRKKKKGRR